MNITFLDCLCTGVAQTFKLIQNLSFPGFFKLVPTFKFGLSNERPCSYGYNQSLMSIKLINKLLNKSS